MGEIFNINLANSIPLGNFLLYTVCSIIAGFAAAAVYMFRNKYSKSMPLTLVLLPVTVQVIIMVVNGNIGIGIAVLGAFSLIRFRSIAGNARDIGILFFAMALGLVIGMGYILYAFIFIVIFSAINILLVCVRFGKGNGNNFLIKIIIPESLNYNNLFDDILAKYATSFELVKVKTIEASGMYELSFDVRFTSASVPKELIDELHGRNGNLNIQVSRDLLQNKGDL